MIAPPAMCENTMSSNTFISYFPCLEFEPKGKMYRAEKVHSETRKKETKPKTKILLKRVMR